jgi:hypothetical protein
MGLRISWSLLLKRVEVAVSVLTIVVARPIVSVSRFSPTVWMSSTGSERRVSMVTKSRGGREE